MNGSRATIDPSPVYGSFAPSAALADLIEVIWVQESCAGPAVQPTTIVPTGRVELIFHYGDDYVQHFPGSDSVERMATCHVVGQQKRPIQVRATGETGIVIVRFKPWGAHALLGGVLGDINDSIVDLELVWTRAELGRLVEKLAMARSATERVSLMEHFLIARLQQTELDRLGVQAIGQIHRDWGRTPVEQVARSFDLGRRQFNRRFTKSIGASPRQMSKVLRAQKAIACLRGGTPAHDVIECCGYTDQPHLIRDVVSHSLRRPGELARTEMKGAARHYNSTDPSAFCGTTYL